jgi:hypothetical protein
LSRDDDPGSDCSHVGDDAVTLPAHHKGWWQQGGVLQHSAAPWAARLTHSCVAHHCTWVGPRPQCHEKVKSADTQTLKEKYEEELKKEIKKLQRLRDQIKVSPRDTR